MEQTTDTTREPTREYPGELVRPTEGRMLAGVAQGLANRLGIHAWIVRTVFIALIFGGLGIALYAAGWALIRSEDETESPAERFFGEASSTRSWLGIGLIFLAALILLDNLTFISGGVVWAVGLLVVGVLLYMGQIPAGHRANHPSKEGARQMTTTKETTSVTTADTSSEDSAAGTTGGDGAPPTPAPTPPILPPGASRPAERSILGRVTLGVMLVGMGILAILDNIDTLPIEAFPRHYLALAITILGVGLAVGGFVGRARWLILIGAVLLPTLLFSPVFEYDWNADSFDARYAPEVFTELEGSYVVDVGSLDVDLRELPWDGQTVTLDADVDLGELQIWIPDDVGIEGIAGVNIGSVSTPGRSTAGLGDRQLAFDEPGLRGTVILDAHVDIGNLEIWR